MHLPCEFIENECMPDWELELFNFQPDSTTENRMMVEKRAQEPYDEWILHRHETAFRTSTPLRTRTMKSRRFATMTRRSHDIERQNRVLFSAVRKKTFLQVCQASGAHHLSRKPGCRPRPTSQTPTSFSRPRCPSPQETSRHRSTNHKDCREALSGR